VFFLQIDISQIVIHEADEPDSGLDFLDADRLACRMDGFCRNDSLMLSVSSKSGTGLVEQIFLRPHRNLQPRNA
jgi:hypothetical protein